MFPQISTSHVSNLLRPLCEQSGDPHPPLRPQAWKTQIQLHTRVSHRFTRASVVANLLVSHTHTHTRMMEGITEAYVV